MGKNRQELVSDIASGLLVKGIPVCVMADIYPDEIRKMLTKSACPSAYAALSLPALLTVLPTGDTVWIYAYVSRGRQPRIPLEPFLFQSALDIYEINVMHILRWNNRDYGLLMDDLWRAIDCVLVPRASADYWESEREYVARALLPTGIDIRYEDDIQQAVLVLNPRVLNDLPDWHLQIDVCLVGDCE